MRNIKLTIEYDGSKYHGWQSQLNAASVQEVIESAIEKLTGEECKLTGASRTDTGVHALGQVANFTTHAPIPPDKYFLALNTLLPNDVVIVKSEEVAPDFHSRFWAKGKRYRYLIYNSKAPSALLRSRAYHVPVLLDMDAMKVAANFYLGTHDFAAFRATGGSARTSERTMRDVLLTKEDNIIKFEIEGDGFLYNMVRIMVGTLVDVGMGKIAPTDIPKIIKDKDRTQAGRTAPPQGLYLVKVFYE